MAFQYPLNIRFKLVALAPRMFVTDASGRNLMFVSQKVLAFKEDITVFQDESRTTQLYKINADRMIDFTATYHFTDVRTGRSIGAVSSRGWRSIWKATYEVKDSSGTVLNTIEEENPWVKILDSLAGEIPFVGIFTGFFLNPKYLATDRGGNDVMRITKQPSFFEGLYTIDKLANTLDDEGELRLLLSFMLMIQFMRRRG